MTTRTTTKQLEDKIDFINSSLDNKELVLMQSYGTNHIGIRAKGSKPGAGIDQQLEGGMTKQECMSWLRAFHYGTYEDSPCDYCDLTFNPKPRQDDTTEDNCCSDYPNCAGEYCKGDK